MTSALVGGRRRVRSQGAAFAGSRSGGVAILFGLALVPLVLAAGAAMDYARASDARTQLLAAADAAALSAVTQDAMALTPADAERRAQRMFDAQAARARFSGDLTGTVRVTQSNSRRSSTVTFEGQVPTTLLRIVGLGTIAIGGTSTASGTPPPFVDFYLLLDNTPSMGVGATLDDIATMVAATGKDQCAFACHDLSAGGKDFYALAKKLGVSLRIDVVRQATQRLMDSAAASAVVPGQYRAGIWTMGASCPSLMPQMISPVTDNLAAARANAAAIDLMTIPFPNFFNDQCTDLAAAIAAMNLQIPAPGDGSRASSPQKVLFFVSDGLVDSFNPLGCTQATTNGRCQETINQAACTALKSRGVRIAVLYTTYLPLPTNTWYNDWIKPFAAQVGPAMQSCASPGLYFEVNLTQGITEAMGALFTRVLAQGRLTD